MKNNEPIRIMHIVNSLQCGGLEKMVIDLADGLNKSRFVNVICCLNGSGELVEEAARLGLRVVVVNKKAGIDCMLPVQIAKIFKVERIDIVHTHNMGPMLYGILAAKLSGIKASVNTKHDRMYKVDKRLLWSVAWCLYKRIIVISEDARKVLLSKYVIAPGKVKVILNGIRSVSRTSEHVRDETRRELGIAPEEMVIGCIARLSAEKDHRTLLNAFHILRSKAKAKLVLIGEGGLRNELEKYAEELGVKNKVLFLGYRKDIPELLEIMDVFVLSSLTEGISISILEAMSAGKAVVATDVGGTPEIIEDGVSGFLVPSGNPVLFARKIDELIDNKKLRESAGKIAKMAIETRFGFRHMIQEYENIYEQLYK